MRPSKHWKPCKHCGIPQCGPGNLCVMCAVIQAVEWGYREPKPSPYQKALARLRQEMREAAARRWAEAVEREERDIPPKPTGITRSEWDGAAFRKWQDAVRRAHYRSGDDERDKGNA